MGWVQSAAACGRWSPWPPQPCGGGAEAGADPEARPTRLEAEHSQLTLGLAGCSHPPPDPGREVRSPGGCRCLRGGPR